MNPSTLTKPSYGSKQSFRKKGDHSDCNTNKPSNCHALLSSTHTCKLIFKSIVSIIFRCFWHRILFSNYLVPINGHSFRINNKTEMVILTAFRQTHTHSQEFNRYIMPRLDFYLSHGDNRIIKSLNYSDRMEGLYYNRSCNQNVNLNP